MFIDGRLITAVSSQLYPLLFVTVSGAHLYGFPSPDSDYDLRGIHILPAREVVGLLLPGIHLMRTGEVEANLVGLNEAFRLPYIDDLIARKLAGPEQSVLEEADGAFHLGEYERLRTVLEEAYQQSRLPETTAAREALNDLLVRLR